MGFVLGILFVMAGGSSVFGAGLDDDLASALQKAGFTGRLEESLEKRLGGPVNLQVADLGRLLFFDKIMGLHSDNSCAGCHSPTNGFGDTQAIAIGIQSNDVVGPKRRGPRNQRRTPMLLNDAFYPALMWNGRFEAVSGDPFDNSKGFHFPDPEGDTRFQARDPRFTHLLMAQAHIPPTELTEAAGFTGAAVGIDPRLTIFDDGKGSALPDADASGSRNEPIRTMVLKKLNDSAAYRKLFAGTFPQSNGKIEFEQVGRALAVFQFALTFANAPVDRFAQGERSAMSDSQKRGALLFLGKAGCVRCHLASNDLFSDFQMHNAGVPQIAPVFGVGTGNAIFDGPNEDEDFGLEQVTGKPEDRYRFRTPPLRNVALQPAFFHNGSFQRLEDAVRHELNAFESARRYNPQAAGTPVDLSRLGPVEPVLSRLDPMLRQAVTLSRTEDEDLIEFVRGGLLDARAHPKRLCELVPQAVPSGMTLQNFQGCHQAANKMSEEEKQ